MFGLFKSEDQKKALLRQEIFAALKAGDIKRLGHDKFEGMDILNCCVVEDEMNNGLLVDTNGTRLPTQSGPETLFDMNDWSDLRRQAFHDYRRSEKDGSRSRVFFTLSYFVHKRNIDAVIYLIKHGMTVDNYDDIPPNRQKHSFIAPIYYALSQPVMLKLLLSQNAKATPNVMKMALESLRDYEDENSWQCIKILGEKEPSLQQMALGYIQAFQGLRQKDKIRDFLGFKPVVNSDAAPVQSVPQPVPPQPSAPAPTKKSRKKQGKADAPAEEKAEDGDMVTVERNLGDNILREYYDFGYCERITVAENRDGALSPPLRETFNALGRNNVGLKKAIEEYKKRGKTFDEDATFGTSPSRYRIVASNSDAPAPGAKADGGPL